jgi:hypothetical protein
VAGFLLEAEEEATATGVEIGYARLDCVEKRPEVEDKYDTWANFVSETTNYSL